ncbi:hypothetical protein GJ700_10145 [Duganella sp. FT92W]|uniref:Uncharacterized protein n=1 Tax=Pseudoduganella rivuli TaxID=2666085 RepID=A0A7X2LTQ0_9BURK|nr:hypothetical protein [Pseudoduganella rivuli]MRV72074.1 hypothetical protein [Pseudoduganella rivuli]
MTMHLSRTLQKILGFSISFVTFLANTWLCFAGSDFSLLVKFVFLLVSGALLGALAGNIKFFEGQRKQLAWAATVSAFILWIPVVVATYGFALLGIPLILLYGLAVHAGWQLSQRKTGASD